MKKMIHNIALVFFSYFSMIFPRNKKICVFGAWFGEKFLDNTKYLYLDFEKRDLTCVWITKNRMVCDDLKSKGHRSFMANSARGIWYQLRAKYFFICTGFSDVNESLVGNATIVNFWHGIPLKKIMNDNAHFTEHKGKFAIKTKLLSVPRHDYYVVSTSKVYDRIFPHAFGRDSNHILKLGYPRNDILFNKRERGSLRSRFASNRIIVYMPTHRNSGKTLIPCDKLFDLYDLNDFCAKHNYMFVIKKHYYHSGEKTHYSFSNIIDITGEDIDPQQVLLSADILISDYSGAYIDYLLLNRPIIYYVYDYEEYVSNDRELYFDYDKVTPGFKAKNYVDIRDELNRLVNDNDQWEEERKKITNLYFRKIAQEPVSQKVYDCVICHKTSKPI